MNIADIKECHSKIGGTPWKASAYSSDYYTQGYRVKTWNDGEIASCIDEKGEVDFIANAPSDIAYLLSIIEQADKALSDTKDELAKVVNKMCGGTVKQYIFEETREVYYSVDKALQAIRKGD